MERWHDADRTTRAAWIVLLSSGIYVIVAGGGFILAREVPAKVLLQILALGILAVWLGGSITRPSWRPTTPLVRPVALAVAALVLSALLSQRPRLSLEPTLGGMGFALAFLMLTRLLADAWFRSRLAAALITLVALVAVGYVIEVVTEWVAWWQLVGTITPPPLRPSWASLSFGSPNDVPALLLAAGPLAVILVCQKARGRTLAWALASAILLAIVLAGSRGGYVGVGVGLVVGLGLLGAELRSRRDGTSFVGLLRRRPALVAATALLVVVGTAFLPAVASRFAQGGEDVRLDLWRSAFAIFIEHPLTGAGPGTWAQLKIIANLVEAPNHIFSEAHSTYFQSAAELGAVGMLALGLLTFHVARRLAAAWRQGGPLRIQASGVAIGLAGVAAQCLVANLTSLPFMALLLIVVVAWIDSAVPGDGADRVELLSPPMTVRARAIPSAGLAAVLLTGAWFVVVDAAALHDAAGNDAAWEQDWSRALEHYDAARQLDPELTLYHLRAASMLARLDRVAEARAVLVVALQADPLAAHAIGLAALDLSLGDSAVAFEHARSATAIGAVDPMVALNAGLIAEAVGDATSALEEYANAIAADPPLAGNDFWIAPDRVIAKAEVVDAAVERSSPANGALILAYAGRTGESAEIFERLDDSPTNETLRAAAQWLGGDSVGAMSRLKDQLRVNPLDWFAAAWLSRIARLSGDAGAAQRYERWALIVQFDKARGVVMEHSAIPPVTDAAIAGLPGAYPSGTYLRETGAYLLMPQLTLIGNR